jgi:hypothetical protein
MMTTMLFPADQDDHQQLSVDEMFARWWQQYPRKVDKGSARKAFRRVLTKKIATFAELMAGVHRYAMERTGEDPQFTKHGATWLNAESWANEPLVRPPKPLSTADSMIAGMMEAITRGESAARGAMGYSLDDDDD